MHPKTIAFDRNSSLFKNHRLAEINLVAARVASMSAQKRKAPSPRTMVVSAATLNKLARTLKSLHVPGKPLILANSYDYLSTMAVASVPTAKALATDSHGVARANGTEDDDMDMETNIIAARLCAKTALDAHKPLTVDLQDGYGG